MKHFLMCEPKFFDVRYVINPWMECNLGKVNQALARRDFEVIETDVSEFLKAGGACKCLTLEI